MEFQYENEHLFVPYPVEPIDGSPGQGIHVIPIESIASRMELLGIDDPGVALEVLRAEPHAGEYYPYEELMSRCDKTRSHNQVDEERQLTLDRLPIEVSADTERYYELKEFLRNDLSELITEKREEIRGQLFMIPAEEMQ